MVNIHNFEFLIETIIVYFRLNVLTNMNAAEEISEDQERQFQLDLEICCTDFNRLLLSNE